MVSSRVIYVLVAILVIVTATVDANGYEDALGFMVQTGSSSNCRGSIADCIPEEEEFGLDSEISRRILASKKYVSYGAMRKNSVPCSRRGASYYNCQRGAQANPYSRGCSTITRCRRWNLSFLFCYLVIVCLCLFYALYMLYLFHRRGRMWWFRC